MAVCSQTFFDAVRGNINMLVPWYLMASVAYYCWNESLLDDAEYDQLCAALLEAWPFITHWHRGYVDIDALQAGTAFHMSEWQYPLRARCSAWGKLHDGQFYKPLPLEGIGL